MTRALHSPQQGNTAESAHRMEGGAVVPPSKRALRFYQAACVVLVVAVGIAGWLILQRELEERRIDFDIEYIQPDAPFAYDIHRLIDPLRYSGIPRLLHPDSRLELDFEHSRWRLRNIRRFDPATGQVALDEGRYGLCGELAAYASDRVRPLLGDRYAVEVVRAAESGFFPAFLSAHYVVRITDRTAREGAGVFILDPALRTYGSLDRFQDYLFFEATPTAPFVAEQDPDQAFRVGAGMPFHISRRSMLTLVVEREHGRFDPDHFRISLVATGRHNYMSQPVLIFRKSGGVKEIVEHKTMGSAFLGTGEFQRLRQRLLTWFEAL